MKTMTSPPQVRTRAAEATAAPSGNTRRRAVPQTGTVRRPAGSTGTTRTGTTSAPQAPFAVLVVGLLGGALVGLLLLNTALAQQAFTRSELQRENQRLDERKQGLQEDIAREGGPEILHAKARSLGMRDAGQPGSVVPGALVPSATPSR
jgi:hypothetical protein